MVEAILLDKNLIVPCAAYMQGEYGLDGIYFGVATMLGREGITRVVEYDLDEAESAALRTSAAGVLESTEAVKGMIEERK
jgi:malate dehydrogenase